MAPKIPSVIKCTSTTLLEYELSEVRSGLDLQETEDNWDRIHKAFLRLNAIVVGSSADYPSQIIAACKALVRPIINSINSERSRLSGAATDLLTMLATHLQRPFEALIPLFVPILLTLASRSNKIFNARAKACLMAIVEHCGSPALLPLLRHAISDKSVTLRLTTIDIVVACLNCFNPPDLEAPGRVEDVEAVIRATARDANADIRKSSRKAFEAYKILFPSRVAAFVAPLTPTMRKYLDVKSTVAADPRKPLTLSSSASAPSVPSSSQEADVLSRSQPATQATTKGAALNAAPTRAPFTRVARSGKSSKPSSSSAGSAPASETALMPPPPPPQEKKSSSGPVRPPPAVRQAIAASGTMPMRPKLGRHASRPNLQMSGTMVPDLTKSQPILRGGAQRPERAPTPPAAPSPVDVMQSVPKPPSGEEVTRARSTTGARRVPKAEGALVLIDGPVGPAPNHKQVDRLKGSAREKEKGSEKATFASSASSLTSAHTDVLAQSRPPSRLTSSTSSRAEEEELKREIEKAKEEGKRRENETDGRTRTESRTEQVFRPRPVSRAESHKRSDSAEKELHPRPASRSETQNVFRPPPKAEVQPVFTRPESRVEKTRTRPESRAERTRSRAEPRVEMAVAHPRPESRVEPVAPEKPRRRRVEQTSTLRPQSEAPPSVPAGEQRERRKKRREVPPEVTEAPTRAPSKRGKEEKNGQEKPTQKRREEAADGEERRKRRREREALPSRDAATLDGSKAGDAHAVTKPAVDQGLSETQPEITEPSDAPRPPGEEQLNPSGTQKKDDYSGHLPKNGPAGVEGCASVIGEHPSDTSEPRTPERHRQPQSHDYGGVRPLAIRKASGVPTSSNAEFAAESEVPLPPSPPEPRVYETPAPVRLAIASRRNQVPATPISKLLVSIQREFDADHNVIEEEDEAESALPSAQSAAGPTSQGAVVEEPVSKEHHGHHNVKAGENPFFVETRPKKHKSERSKDHAHNRHKSHNGTEARVPFMPKTENR